MCPWCVYTFTPILYCRDYWSKNAWLVRNTTTINVVSIGYVQSAQFPRHMIRMERFLESRFLIACMFLFDHFILTYLQRLFTWEETKLWGRFHLSFILWQILVRNPLKMKIYYIMVFRTNSYFSSPFWINVDAIDFSRNRLTGTLSDAIGGLTNLGM
jgi:hypothetical protein